MSSWSVCGLLAAWLAAASCGAGCGSGGPPIAGGPLELVPVAGTVRLDGRPLPDMEVRLVASDGSFVSARTNAAGRFEMGLDTATSGVPRGPRRVEIRRNPPDGDEDQRPAAAPTDYLLESSDRLLIEQPVTDLELRLVTSPSGS